MGYLTEAEAWAGIADVIEHAPEALVHREPRPCDPEVPAGERRTMEGLCAVVSALERDGAITGATGKSMYARIRRTLRARALAALRSRPVISLMLNAYLHRPRAWSDGVRLGYVREFLKQSLKEAEHG